MTEKNYRILVVDDSPQDIHLLLEVLQQGFTVTATTSAEDMLKLLARGSRPDLILMDVNMPDMNGYEACKMVRQSPEYGDIKIVFLSANDSTEEVLLGLEAGASDYIVKPYDPALLRSKISRVIELSNNQKNLKQQAESASHLVQTVLSESSGLANIVNFLRTCLTVTTPSELMEIMIETFQEDDLNTVVCFCHEDLHLIESSSGEPSMLEVDLLERLKGYQEPFLERETRLFVVHKSIIVLIKNTPDNEAKLGSLKDYVMILLEGANDKLQSLRQVMEEPEPKPVFCVRENTLTEEDIKKAQHDQYLYYKTSMNLLDGITYSIENHFSTAGFTAAQEDGFRQVLSDATSELARHLESIWEANTNPIHHLITAQEGKMVDSGQQPLSHH